MKRPIIRYHGGKWLLAEWIISHFPSHKIYVEPYGGAASILLKKKRSFAEVYNDLDDEMVNLFFVMRDHGSELKEKLYFTPFSRHEFDLSYQPTDDKIERARRTIVRAYMGFGSSIANYTGFRATSFRSGSTPANDWKNYHDAMTAIIERLRGVTIENRDAFRVMLQHDSVKTLHYVDPPYVHETRYKKSNSNSYRFEMTNEDHVKMCELLKQLKGTVVLSAYQNDLYDDHLVGWKKIMKRSFADGARPRIEILYINKFEHLKQIKLL